MKQLLFISFVLLFGACNKEKNIQNTQNKENTTKEQVSSSKEENQAKKTSKEANPAEDKIRKAIEDYCAAFNESDFERTAQLFAPKVKQWITIKNTTPDAITKEAKRFLGNKKEVKYEADLKVLKLNDKTALVPIAMSWTGYEAAVVSEIIFDEDFKIISYKEKNIIKQKGKFKTPEAISKKGKLILKMTDLSLPYTLGTTSDNNFYVSTMGGTEDMIPFEADFGDGIPTQIEGKIALNDKVWLIIADQSYRFYTASAFVTYTQKGEAIDKLGIEENNQITIDKDLIITSQSGTYKVNQAGKFIKQ